jgi:ABC-type Mn2+/Zn2+ transport system permease subunit
MIGLIIVGLLVVAAVVAYRLHKSGKAVTVASVEAGVASTVAQTANSVSKSI